MDYDRIIFSSAFRHLQDKTQVIPFSQSGFVHTRLTHSLEVSVVGRSLGRAVGNAVIQKHPALAVTHGYQPHDFGTIVAAACLAHDIGNPPFGHSGEQAIGDFFTSGAGAALISTLTEAQQQDLIRFEGNANGFRIVTEDREGVPGGLRLSYATLGTFTKYPKASIPIQPTKKSAIKNLDFFKHSLLSFPKLPMNWDCKALKTPFTAIHLPFWSKQQMISVTPLSILKMASTWAGFQSPTLWSTLSNW